MEKNVPATSASSEVLATAALLVASFAYRLPPLLNARSTNSDAAIVGLQAMHVLRGEFSPFLWGSGYQTSADALVTALFFETLGPSPFVLMLSALSLHVLATCLVFAILKRHFSVWLALLLTMPLVVTPSSVHSYALYPPRQLSLTLAIAAFWAIDSSNDQGMAARKYRATWWLGIAGGLSTLAVSADPYPMLLLPMIWIYATLVIRARRQRLPESAAFVGFTTAGIIPFVVMHHATSAKSGPMTLTLAGLDRHWRLLVDECLPWALSYRVYYARDIMNYEAWDAPLWFRATGIVGALTLATFVFLGLLSPLQRNLPAEIRRLGFVGALAFPVTLAAFLVSVMAMDRFSMRYLAVLTLMTPFAVAPAARALGAPRFALAFAPHLIASAIAGWVGYGPFVHGVVPVVETPELRDDYMLASMLRERGVRYAIADYWTAYRLTFLFREEVIVVPTNPAEDRHAPYRRAFDAQQRFAYVYDPGRSREDRVAIERKLIAQNSHTERASAGALEVLFVTRRTPQSDPIEVR